MPKMFVVITGIKEIDRKLKRLEPKVQKKVLRQSMRSGLKVMAAEVKSQVPVETGLTRSAVKVKAVKRKKRGSIELEVAVGSKPGLTKQSGGKPVFYPAVVEYKHDPFMRRSFTAKGEEARQTTMRLLRDGIEREAKTS